MNTENEEILTDTASKLVGTWTEMRRSSFCCARGKISARKILKTVVPELVQILSMVHAHVPYQNVLCWKGADTSVLLEDGLTSIRKNLVPAEKKKPPNKTPQKKTPFSQIKNFACN